MYRKLHNSLMALLASCGLLAVGLMAASPAVPDLYAPDRSALAQRDTGSDGDASAALAERERAPRRSLRRGRPSVSMPFFSFAPRG